MQNKLYGRPRFGFTRFTHKALIHHSSPYLARHLGGGPPKIRTTLKSKTKQSNPESFIIQPFTHLARQLGGGAPEAPPLGEPHHEGGADVVAQPPTGRALCWVVVVRVWSYV